MRALPRQWQSKFDAVVNLFSSFGFFADSSDDERVLAEFSRVLKPGGILIWHGGNRDVIATRYARRDWWPGEKGEHIAQERSFDSLSGVLTVKTRIVSDSVQVNREHRIRVYTATRLAELCADAGMDVQDVQDGDNPAPLSRSSSTMLLVARKRH